MIEIRIVDTATAEPKHLAAIARALLEIAGERVTSGVVLAPKFAETCAVGELSIRREYAEVPDGVKMGVIDPADVPSAGAAPVRDFFRPGAPVVEGEPSAAEVFGGNATASAPPSTLPDGTPPAPSNGVQTDGATTQASGVDLDKDGLPWNGTIHAGTKSKTKDGCWTKRRGVDEAVVAKVEADLRAVMAIPTPPPGNVPPTGAIATGVPTPPVQVPGPPAPSIVPPALATIPTPPAGAPKITGFAQLLPAVTNGIAAGTLTEAQVQAALQKAGVAVLPMLAPRPDLVAVVAAELFPGQ